MQDPVSPLARSGRTLPLEEAGGRDLARVGAKAANLARLMGLGLPVPPGFCVTGEAYREHVRSAVLAPKMKSVLRSAAQVSPEAAASILAELREAILDEPPSEDLRDEIEAAWRELGADRVAVRSSATAEDLPGASFAGQHETFLGVASCEGCLEALKRCWASLWTERAFRYRAGKEIDHAGVDMAVLVQELVPAEAAGVLFTVDPVSGASDRMVMEGSFGLGETVVLGRVSPDRVVILKDELRVVERAVSTKTVEIVPDEAGGTREQPVEPARADRPAFEDVAALRLAVLAVKAEKEFGRPQDLEWAMHAGKVWILQCRPITALPGAPGPRPGGALGRLTALLKRKEAGARAPAEADGRARADLPEAKEGAREDRQVWTRANAAEVLPDVMSPMTWSAVKPIVWQLFGALPGRVAAELERHPLLELIAGRAYFNLNTFVACLRQMPVVRKRRFSELFGGTAGTAAGIDEIVIPEGDLPELGIGRAGFASMLPGLVYDLLTHSPAAGRRFVRRVRRQTEALCAVDLRTLTDEELAGLAAGIVKNVLGSREAFRFAGVGMMCSTGLLSVCRRYFGEEGAAIASRLLSGLGGHDNAEAGLELWRLAALVRRHTALEKAVLSAGQGFRPLRESLAGTPPGDVFLDRWDAFLHRHGHHARGEMELLNARWSERPDHVLDLLRAHLRSMDRADAVARMKMAASERAALAADCRRRLWNPFKRLLLGFMLKQAQIATPIRENMKSELVRRLALVRRILLELARSLVWRRVLAEPEDVFFLTLEELPRTLSRPPGLDAREVVAERRAEYARNLEITPPAVVRGRPDPEDFVNEERLPASGVLKGVAVCPGVVEGPARVILQSDAETVRPGEILVCPSADPGWAPYFLDAAGVVMDVGGIMSHGSIVVREYGVPCVVNVGPATKILKTGQTIRVDGDRGKVTVIR